MRTPKNTKSALRFPLDTILGYTGNVRVLRVLFRVNQPVSKSKISELTGLSLPGVHKTADRLLESGIIAYQGSGKQHVVTLKSDHSMCDALRTLFAQEMENWEIVINELKLTISRLDKSPLSVFIFGSVAEENDQHGDPLHIAVVDTLRNIDDITGYLRENISDKNIEQRFNVFIELEGFTKADLSGKEFGNVMLLWGVHPSDLFVNQSSDLSSFRTHEQIDYQSKENMQILVKLLRESPEIIDRAVAYLTEEIEKTDSAVKNELRVWKQLLENSSLQQLTHFLTSDSERAVRLRQYSPFWMVLDERDRERFLELKADGIQRKRSPICPPTIIKRDD